MRFPLAYDATTTRQEFVRLLPQASGEAELREIDGRFCGKGWSVRLTPIPPLAIGMVRLERHRVRIEFDGLTAEEQDRFMQRFTLHYQRGGG
ncbi:MAG: hypothetical protein FD157_3141 [Rhodocyclaceae bacterium]|jgi:hypothetical protein|nr:MAG: hypothetical protein FD157_3141 [Rhodocyclaceae bacterium]TND03748.1 MAG: hypothetical protein FD118_1166 [Rhodocyclaceae bacterium]